VRRRGGRWSGRGRVRQAGVERKSKRFALKLAVRRIDLTTLEEADTPSKAAALSSKACIS
jgi:hypothetical protein